MFHDQVLHLSNSTIGGFRVGFHKDGCVLRGDFAQHVFLNSFLYHRNQVALSHGTGIKQKLAVLGDYNRARIVCINNDLALFLLAASEKDGQQDKQTGMYHFHFL